MFSLALANLLLPQVMTPEYKETKNMSASNTYGVLTIMSSVILILPMLFFEGLASKDAFDDVKDKATLLKVTNSPQHAAASTTTKGAACS